MTLLRAYILLSVCIVSAGPIIAPLLLNIIAGERWKTSGAGSLLATFCYYIPLLAINGLTEAFVSSVATESELNIQTVWMVAFTIGLAVESFVLLQVLKLGAQGLVWINAFNMVFRIIYCTLFIRDYLGRYGTGLKIGALVPRSMTISAGVVTYAMLARMESAFSGGLADLVKSGGVVAGLVLLM